MMTFVSHTPRMSLALTLVAAALVAGCASGVKLDKPAEVPVETRSTAPAQPPGGANANANAANQSSVASVDLAKSDAALMSNLPKVVYFDFDSFVVKDDSKPVVESNAKALAADRKRHVTIEGHTDERGGREYNLALGQKRAEAVGKALALLGAQATQVEAVSFGKERPAADGHDEAAWAKNRRAEIVYR